MKKIKQPLSSSLLEKILFPNCRSQLTGQGLVVQDEPVAFLLVEAVVAPGEEGMGWGRKWE